MLYNIRGALWGCLGSRARAGLVLGSWTPILLTEAGPFSRALSGSILGCKFQLFLRESSSSAVPRGAARHPGMNIQGMLSVEKLSAGFVSSFSCSPSRFELGLSAAVGSSQPLPLLREPRAPSDVVCPKTLLGRTKPTKAFLIRGSQPRSCRARVPGTALFAPAGSASPGAVGRGDDGSAGAPAAPRAARTDSPRGPGPACPHLPAALASHSLPAAPRLLSQPHISSLLGNGKFPPGWFQWLTDPSPLASPQFLLGWLELSLREQRFFPGTQRLEFSVWEDTPPSDRAGLTPPC